MHLDLKRLDLNLLLVFEAVYRLRSVTRAAAELALSASALSHALIRLRKALADELFYRVGNDMHPTVYADSLAPTVSESLALLAKGLHPRPRFVPAESRESFTFAITDYTAFAVFPALMAQMQRLAPGLSFQLRYSERKVALNDLLAGRIDFALGFTETDGESYPEIDEVSWLEDEYVAICSPAFSVKYGELTLENYLRARHLVVTPWNEQRGVIDYQLDKLGLQRDIAIRTPSLLGAPFIVADSELVMSMPRYAAQNCGRQRRWIFTPAVSGAAVSDQNLPAPQERPAGGLSLVAATAAGAGGVIARVRRSADTLPQRPGRFAVRVGPKMHVVTLQRLQQQAVVHLGQVILVLLCAVRQQHPFGFVLRLVGGTRHKQAELVQFRQLIAAVAAHVDEKQLLFTGERRRLQAHVVTVRPVDARIAVDMHLALITEPLFTQQRIRLFRSIRRRELYVVQLNIGARRRTAHIKHQ